MLRSDSVLPVRQGISARVMQLRRAPGAPTYSRLAGRMAKAPYAATALPLISFLCVERVSQDDDTGAARSTTEKLNSNETHLLLVHEVRQPAHIQLVRALCHLRADDLQRSWIHIGGWLQGAKSSSRPEIKVMRAPYLHSTESLSSGCWQQAEAAVRQVRLALMCYSACPEDGSMGKETACLGV